MWITYDSIHITEKRKTINHICVFYTSISNSQTLSIASLRKHEVHANTDHGKTHIPIAYTPVQITTTHKSNIWYFLVSRQLLNSQLSTNATLINDDFRKTSRTHKCKFKLHALRYDSRTAVNQYTDLG